MSLSVSSLKYFWQEKGDLERSCDWEDHQAEIAERFPELVKVWNDYKMAKKLVGIVVASLPEDSP